MGLMPLQEEKKTPEPPFCHVKTDQEVSHLPDRKSALTKNQVSQCLGFDYPGSKTIRNKCHQATKQMVFCYSSPKTVVKLKFKTDSST